MIKGRIIQEAYQSYKMVIYVPPSYDEGQEKFPVLYSHDGKQVEKLFEKLLPELEEGFLSGIYKPFIWIGIYSEQRIHDYTPWAMPALDEKFEDFKGLGDTYISDVVNALKPYIERKYRIDQAAKSNWLMGYSLGGLISVYAAYRYDCFGKIVSICGSFWYEDFVRWARAQDFISKNADIYMIYGEHEGAGKESIQKNAVACTKEMIEILKAQLSSEDKVSAVCDQGAHHSYVLERYKNAIKYLIKQ